MLPRSPIYVYIYNIYTIYIIYCIYNIYIYYIYKTACRFKCTRVHILNSCTLKDLQFEAVECEEIHMAVVMNRFEYKKHKIFTEYQQ